MILIKEKQLTNCGRSEKYEEVLTFIKENINNIPVL